MKKIVLTLAALLTMTVAFAEGTNDNESTEAAKYEFAVNMNSLSKALDLNYDQRIAVEDVTSMFTSDMTNAAAASGTERAKLKKDALIRNLANMRAILDEAQYHTYVALLNTTLNNRGLNK